MTLIIEGIEVKDVDLVVIMRQGKAIAATTNPKVIKVKED